jgi:O-antigen/teichoic acid export membrane protein
MLETKLQKKLDRASKYLHTDIKYLTKGVFYLFSSNSITAALVLVLSIFYANYLPIETYGQYKYILSIVGLLAIPTLEGMATALTRSVSKGNDGDLAKVIRIKILFGALSSLICLAISFYYYLGSNNTLSISFLLVSAFLPFYYTFSIYKAFLEGKKLFKTASKYTIISKIVLIPLLIGIILFTNNLHLLLFTLFLVETTLSGFFLYSVYKNNVRNNNTDPETLSYGKHLSAITIFMTVSGKITSIALWHYSGPISLALYSFSVALPDEIRKVFKTLIPLSTPKFSTNNTKLIKKTLPRKALILTVLLALVIATYIFLAPAIFNLIFPKYIDAVLYTQLYALTLIFFPRNLFHQVLAAKMKTRPLYIIAASTHTLKIIFIFTLIPQYDIFGIIYAQGLAMLYNTLIVLYFFKKL